MSDSRWRFAMIVLGTIAAWEGGTGLAASAYRIAQDTVSAYVDTSVTKRLREHETGKLHNYGYVSRLTVPDDDSLTVEKWIKQQVTDEGVVCFTEECEKRERQQAQKEGVK
jgi:hypothetical protein